MPITVRAGVTKDISVWLQFSFWQPILYLDHKETWPSYKERTGRWVGVTENIGDQLTYWILDEQSKQLVSRSVVRPLNNNRRVKQDPELTKESDPKAVRGQTFPSSGKTPYIPATDDNYRGASKLRYSNGDIEQHPYIRQFPLTKKVPYKEAKNIEHILPSKDKFS